MQQTTRYQKGPEENRGDQQRSDKVRGKARIIWGRPERDQERFRETLGVLQEDPRKAIGTEGGPEDQERSRET